MKGSEMSDISKEKTPSTLELLRSAGERRVKELLPTPLGIWWSDHSTGCQITIWAKDDDGPLVEVWRLSTWYSHIYEFNERGKHRGLQPGCEWAKPAIDKLFSQLLEQFEQKQKARAKREAKQASDEARNHNNAVNRYAQKLARGEDHSHEGK